MASTVTVPSAIENSKHTGCKYGNFCSTLRSRTTLHIIDIPTLVMVHGISGTDMFVNHHNIKTRSQNVVFK